VHFIIQIAFAFSLPAWQNRPADLSEGGIEDTTGHFIPIITVRYSRHQQFTHHNRLFKDVFTKLMI